jgi:UDP-N-acetylmuramoylalanine--D-glutamate ligase
MADVRAFAEPKVLIMGGSSKGAEFGELAKVVRDGNVRGVVLIGVEAGKIEAALRAVGYEAVVNLGVEVGMEEIVRVAAGMAEGGDVVILSPACASFDMFESYADRGERFVGAVMGI